MRNGLIGAALSITSGSGSSALIEKTVTSNGTYIAAQDNADGYSKFTVNVSSSGGTLKIRSGTSLADVEKIWCPLEESIIDKDQTDKLKFTFELRNGDYGFKPGVLLYSVNDGAPNYLVGTTAYVYTSGGVYDHLEVNPATVTYGYDNSSNRFSCGWSTKPSTISGRGTWSFSAPSASASSTNFVAKGNGVDYSTQHEFDFSAGSLFTFMFEFTPAGSFESYLSADGGYGASGHEFEIIKN